MLKTLTKTSTKTKILVAIAIVAASGAALAYGLGGYPGAKISKEKLDKAKQYQAQQAAEWKKRTALDTALLGKGDPKASAEIERWMNAKLEYEWTIKGGKSEKQTALHDAICKFIDGKLAPSDWINGCKTGSVVETSFGSGIPKIDIASTKADRDDLAKKGVIHYAITFSGGMKSTDANIFVKIKCKGPVLHVDGTCPDPSASISEYKATLASSSAVIDVTTKGTYTMKDQEVGKVTAALDLNLCFKIAVVGKKCWNVGDALSSAADKPLNDFFADVINGL